MCPETFRRINVSTLKAPLSCAAFRNAFGLLVVRFTGEYPDGPRGRGCAEWMGHICESLVDEYAPPALIVDLSDLSYRWGDDMEIIFQIDEKVRQATVV